MISLIANVDMEQPLHAETHMAKRCRELDDMDALLFRHGVIADDK
jgi:hypothetical protein